MTILSFIMLALSCLAHADGNTTPGVASQRFALESSSPSLRGSWKFNSPARGVEIATGTLILSGGTCIDFSNGSNMCSPGVTQGGTIQGQTTFTSTVTVLGQDGGGNSIKTSGCVLLQGGQVCGPASGAGSSSTTFTGANTFAGTTTFSGATIFSTFTYSNASVLGVPGLSMSTSNANGNEVTIEQYLSVDAVAQSSGCVGVAYWDSTRNLVVWSSSITASLSTAQLWVAIPYEPCQPLAVCKFIIRGIVQYVGTSASNTTRIEPSGIRCVSSNTAANYYENRDLFVTGANGSNFNRIGVMTGLGAP